MSPWDDISRAIAATTGSPFSIDQHAAGGGGGINSAYRIEGGGAGYFVKLNAAEKAEMFAAYRDAYPLDAGYARRKHLYNLYHVLNHLNLFGGSYLGQAGHLISELLAEA